MLLLLLPLLENTFFYEKGKELLFKVCTHLLQKENLYFLKMMENNYIKFLTVDWNLHNFTRCFWKKSFEKNTLQN